MPAAASVGEMRDMSDFLFIAIMLAFFAVCVAYVRGLDRLVRTSEESEGAHEVELDSEVVA
jgi:hypothetical protein